MLLVKLKQMNSSKAFALATAIACVLLFPSEGTPQEKDWLSYYPAVARLQGKLIKIQKYGKPSYGENPDKDEKVEVPILILQSPVRIRASSASSVNNESLTNVSFVQAIFPPEMGKNYAQHF